jgi:hypothetical protein
MFLTVWRWSPGNSVLRLRKCGFGNLLQGVSRQQVAALEGQQKLA